MRFGLQQVHGHSRDQCTGQDVRRNHGKDDCFGKRNKEKFGNPTEEEHGEKHNTDTQGRDQRGYSDLRGSLEDAIVEGSTFFQMTLDIFDGDRGVVDQDTYGESKAAQSHDVDRLVQETEDHHRGQDGERNRDGNDDCAAPASEENQDHQAGERRSDDGFPDDPVDGAAHEDRLIQERRYLELRGEGLGYVRQDVANALHHVDGGSIPGLEYG